jgi:hypothetical protein
MEKQAEYQVTEKYIFEQDQPFAHLSAQFVPLKWTTVMYVMSLLEKSEVCILLYMIAKIEAFSKDSEAISYNSISKWTAVKGRNQISKALKHLKEIGLIEAYYPSRRKAARYSINLGTNITFIKDREKRFLGATFANGDTIWLEKAE